jgi:hypothetical protein
MVSVERCIIKDITEDFFMTEDTTDLQKAYCQHITNTQNLHWEKDAVMKTVVDNFWATVMRTA